MSEEIIESTNIPKPPSFGVVAQNQAFSDVAAEGSSTKSARADHKHGMPDNPVTSAAFRIVGYLQENTLVAARTSACLSYIDFKKYNDLIYTSVGVTSGADATLTTADLATTITRGASVIAAAKAANPNIKVWISIAGTTNLKTILADGALSAQLVTNIHDFVIANNYDGANIDLEGVTGISAVLSPFIIALEAALTPHLKGVSAAVSGASQNTDTALLATITSAAVDKCKFITVMAYDMGAVPYTKKYPVHAHIMDMETVARLYETYDLTKVIVGIPMYGDDNTPDAIIWSRIVDYSSVDPTDALQQITVATVDGTTIHGGVLWYGGIDLAQSKVQWLKYYGYGGVMIFDAGQDSFTKRYSMLQVIYRESLAPPLPDAQQRLLHTWSNYADSDSLGGTEWWCQTFTPAVTEAVRMVRLRLDRTAAASGDIIVSLKAVDGAHKPTGAALATSTVALSTLTQDVYDVIDFDFGADYRCLAGVEYALEIKATGMGANTMYTNLTTAGGFAGGQRGESANSGVAWTMYASDLWFQIRGR